MYRKVPKYIIFHGGKTDTFGCLTKLIVSKFYWYSIFKEFENLSVEKMTLSTALGFEPRSFVYWYYVILENMTSFHLVNKFTLSQNS